MSSFNEGDERYHAIIKEELAPYIIQRRARDDPSTGEWQPTNEHAVAGGIFFIDEQQPSGEYDLLKVPILNGQLSGRTMKVGMCNVKDEDVETEREDRLLFPDMDRILALAHQDAKSFVVQLAEAAWLNNPAFTGEYAGILTQQFEKIEKKNWTLAHVIALHRTDAIFTAICKGERRNTVWFRCPVCPEQIICLFRARLRLDGHMDELAPIPAIVEIYSAIRGCYITINELVFLGGDGKDFKKRAGRAILSARAIKRKKVIAKMNWEKTLLQAGADDLKDMLDILQEMNQIKMEDNSSIGKASATALKLTPEGGG